MGGNITDNARFHIVQIVTKWYCQFKSGLKPIIGFWDILV